jgi:hypothetical protein
MIVSRGGKVLYSNASGCGSSNADDCGCGCKDEYSNAPGDPTSTKPVTFIEKYGKEINAPSGGESPSNKQGVNPDVLKAGADIFTQLGTALIGRQRTYTDAEQRCGKKPKTKKGKETWQKCVDSGGGGYTGGTTTTTSTTTQDETKQGLSKGAKIGIAVGGLAVVGLVIFLVMKSGKSK